MVVSSAKSFAVEEIFLLRSFTQIRKKRGPKMEPCCTPVQTGAHEDDYLCFEMCYSKNFQ